MRITRKIVFFLLMPFMTALPQTAGRIAGSPYPVSSKPDTLYAVTDANYNEGQLLTIETLQGILAQRKPRIYRISNATYNFWLNDLKNNYGVTVINTYDGNFAGLVKMFKNEIKGYIICNTQDNSVNAAISLCGLTGCVAVTQSNASLLDGMGIPMYADVRGKDESWFFNNYSSQVNKNIFSFQKESVDACLADYSVFGKMMTFYNPSFDSATNKIFASFNPNAVLMGWGFDEFQLIAQASSYNVLVHAADYATNISTLTNFEAKTEQKKPSDTLSNDENYHTVCFLMSDGDNLQWTLGGFVNSDNFYASPDRGKFKMGWTASPAMTEISPTVLKYFYDNEASGPDGRDNFVAGVSGLGYIYPDKYKDMAGYSKLTNEYMKKADMRIVNILGNNDSTKYLLPLLQQDNIDALFYYFYSDYSGGKGKITFINNKPVIYGKYNLWDGFETPTSLAQKLNTASKNIYSADGYSLIPVHAWSRSVTDVYNCVKQLGSNVRVVTPDELVSLVSKNLGPRSNVLQFIPNNNSDELSYLVPGDTGTAHNASKRWADYNDKIVYKFNLDSLIVKSNGVKDLFLNLLVGNEYVISASDNTDGPWLEIFRWSQDSTVHIHNLANYSTLTVNLRKYYDKGWHMFYLKLEDGIKSDAYGASVYKITLTKPQVVTGVKDVEGSKPSGFMLEQNFPNPFNPDTKISYQLPTSGHVTLKIYDVLGREVSTLVNGGQNAGKHIIDFNGAGLSSGIYLFRIQSGGFALTKKMVLMK